MYSVRDACAVLGISLGRLRSYLRGGLLVPKRDEMGKIQLSFQDLVVLRKAEGLVALRIPPRRVRTALRAVAERDLGGAGSGQAGLARLDLGSEGDTVVVRDGNKRWDALSGQALLAFGTSQAGAPEASIIPLTSEKSTPPASAPAPPVPELYQQAMALEATAPEQARALYATILEREPDCVDAHVNLGRLLHEAGDVYAALLHYRTALVRRPTEATAAFNAGVALEDLGANADAIAAYLRAIEFDPHNADAHYNVARLFEQTGQPDLAVRHLLLYRQLLKAK